MTSDIRDEEKEEEEWFIWYYSQRLD